MKAALPNSMSEVLLEDKEKLEEEFLSFLRDLNYPEGSVFRGPSFQLKNVGPWRNSFHALFGKATGSSGDEEPFPVYADLAVLDLENCQYASLIEFRLRIDEQIEGEMAALFGAILNCMEGKPPVFLVVPLFNAGFRIYQLRAGTWQELPKKSFPHYPTLVAGLAAEKALIREVRQVRALDRFTITCHLLAGIIALIVVAGLGGFSVLTARQTTMLVLVTLLAVAPHAAGFRLLPPKRGAAKPLKVR